MPHSVPAIVHDGRIELLEQIDLPEGARVLVTIVGDDESDDWLKASQRALGGIWNNAEDDVYGELL